MTTDDDRNAYVRQLGRQARKAGTIARIPTAEPPEAGRVSPQEQFAQVRLAREQARAAREQARAAAGDGEQTADPPATMNAMLRGQLAASKTPEQQQP